MNSSNSAEKIDVHDAKKKYERAREKFESDTTVSAENRQHILTFVDACQLGKTIFGRQKKRIAEKRLSKYLYILRRISRWIGNTDFRNVSQAQMEQFIARVERNNLTTWIDGREVPTSYADWSRRDIKVTLRKFYKWLLGNGRQYPDIVAWIDTHVAERAPPALSIEEIRLLVEHAPSLRRKAMLWTLFETGARAEEYLNIRLGHLEEKDGRFIVRIEHPKTFKRSVPVYEAYSFLRSWLAEHPERGDPNAQLFPTGYRALSKFLTRHGNKTLKKNVTPHLFRHSFATWLAAKKIGRYQMCKIFGWRLSSGMPDQYIDRVGVVEDEAIQSIRKDELSKAEAENAELRISLARANQNAAEQGGRIDTHERADDLLSRVFEDPSVLNAVVAAIRKRGLESELVQFATKPSARVVTAADLRRSQ